MLRSLPLILTPKDRLKKGPNVIAVLAHRDAPTGHIMDHEPGMAAILVSCDTLGCEHFVVSDESWRSVPERSFGPRALAWSSIEDNIDARKMPDWTAADFDSASWPASVTVSGDSYRPFRPRTIPLLRETAMPWTPPAALPCTLAPGQSLDLGLE